MKKTKIVCTIGPASESVTILKQLIDAGMNVARLNFSHGDHEEHRQRIENIKQAAKEKNKSIAILLDTKGPEIRTHLFKNGEATLEKGQTVYISMNEIEGTSERFSINYSGLIDDVSVGNHILLDDGLIDLEVISISKETNEIKTKVLNAGVIKDRKGVNIPNVKVNLPGMTEKDEADILFGIEQDVDFIAASFVRRPSDVFEIRELLEKNNAEHIKIIPKIENREGVENIDQIINVSDGIMVARGDLGVEIPAEEVPFIQKTLIQKCNEAGKPVITATQMLDSMQRNPRPTRAEASDVANAIYDGTDAIMLSGETAAGSYPVDSVKTMHNIATYTEKTLENEIKLTDVTKELTITDAISQSVANLSKELSLKAIITPTESGNTARMVSKHRPSCPIIAVTSKGYVNRQLNLVWGVYPTIADSVSTTDEMLELAVEKALESEYVKQGDRVAITAGVPVGESGTTNLIKIHVVGQVVAKGRGVGKFGAVGRAIIADDLEKLEKDFQEGDIVVTAGTDRTMMEYLKKATGIVTEEGGLTSHAAVVGINLGIPVIVGVKGATKKIVEGEEITIDPSNGHIYQGRTYVI